MAAQNDSSSFNTGHSVALIRGSGAEPEEAFGPVIDLEPLRLAAAEHTRPAADADDTASAETAEPSGHGWRFPVSMPLAAGIALALIAGGLAGAAATAALMHDPAPTASLATADATRALQSSVSALGSELAMLKTGVVTAQKNANNQLGKIAERLDRAEKAQTEPVGKLAKIQEGIERLEHHQVAAAPATPDPSDITGSIKPKEDAKPQAVEGWKLRDFFDGRAVVESKNGTLFRVGPGSVVPGLGKVETIKRDNGKVVVVTASGIIAASLEPRRPQAFYPRW